MEVVVLLRGVVVPLQGVVVVRIPVGEVVHSPSLRGAVGGQVLA